MSKQFGLILNKKNNVSDKANYEANRINREAQVIINKAIEEDPTCFEYDEVYDEMKTKKETNASGLNLIKKESKFITNLKNCADKRKIEQERRNDRKIQKEREQEGDEFADKDVFVTSAYKQKLLERKIYEEREKKEKELEDLMEDRRKEHGISDYYRNYLSLRVGEKIELKPQQKFLDKFEEKLRKELIDDKSNEQTEFKKLNKNQQSKRQRRSSSSSDEEILVAKLRKGKDSRIKSNKADKTKDDIDKDEINKDDNKEKIDKKLETDKNDENNLKEEEINNLKINEKLDEKENLKEDDNKQKENEEDYVEPIKLTLSEILTNLFRKKCVDNEFEEAKKKYFERQNERNI